MLEYFYQHNFINADATFDLLKLTKIVRDKEIMNATNPHKRIAQNNEDTILIKD